MAIITPQSERTAVQLVTHNLYREIHKGIRSELFAVTEEAGRFDPSRRDDRAALAAHVRGVVHLLVTHAEHEDAAIQPALEEHLPTLAERIESDHERLEVRLDELAGLADSVVDVHAARAQGEMYGLYVELASFTSTYLEHQDTEERLVMPALEQAIGVDAVIAMHHAILASIPPDEMARSLALMLPVLNIDERAEMLGGMQAGAPPEVFQGVWNLAASVLPVADHVALGRRLGID